MSDLDEELDAKRKRIERDNKRRRDRELSDVRKVLSTIEGRRLFWRLLSEAGVFRSTFNQNALIGALNEGKRDIGLLLWNDVTEAAPEKYYQMQREYVSDRRSEQFNDQGKS